MLPCLKRTMFRPDSSARIPLRMLLACVAVAALTMMGLTRFASAEPITTNTAGWTVDNFEDSCLKAGGEAITIEDGNGNAVESSCGFSNGSVNTCNWSTDTCVFERVQPTPSGPLDNVAIDPNNTGGVLVDDTPTSTPSGPVLSNETPTLTPATTAEPTEPPPSAVIAVAKYACPDSIGYGESGFDAYINACTQPVPDVSFKLDGASTGNPGEQLTDANGQVTWTEMEGDHYFLTEEVLSGYGTPVAFCIVTGASDYQNYAVSGENRIEFDVADGQTITCYWFNISVDQTGAGATPVSGTATSVETPSSTMPAATVAPDDAATLIIHAYRCEPGYDDRAEDADPAADCVERPTDDITFGLVGTGDSSGEPRRRVKFNGQPGEFVITELAPGDYRLIEVEFEPDQTAFILGCTSNQRTFEGYPFDPFAVVSTAGSVQLSLVVGETLSCDWYDVPPPNPALSLQVYACGTARPSEENCEPASGQFQFVLAPVDGAGAAIGFTTDADGAVELTNVEGSFQLLEIGPQPCAMTATGTGADGNLALDAEQEVVVQIFHCG